MAKQAPKKLPKKGKIKTLSTSPLQRQVRAKAKAVEECFMPEYKNDSPVAIVKALIPGPTADIAKSMTPGMNTSLIQSLQLQKSGVEKIDCGVDLEIEPGYRLQVSTTTFWASVGLVVTSGFLEDGRLKLIVVNIGKDNPLIIPHKAELAYIWLEPMLFTIGA